MLDRFVYKLEGIEMKKFIVAVCCTVLFGSFAVAQDEVAIASPVAPSEEVATAAVPTIEPVAQVQTEGSVIVGEAAPVYAEGNYGSVVAPGCSSCGGGVVPQTFTSAPLAQQGCSSCGTSVAPQYSVQPQYSAIPATYTSAPIAQDAGCAGCGQAAPDCGCAPAPTCCDPCAKAPRQGFMAKRRAKRASRNSCNTCCN